MLRKSTFISPIGIAGLQASMGASAYMITFIGGTFGLSVSSGSDCSGSGNCYDATYTANFAGWTATSQTSFSALDFNVVPGSTNILGFAGPAGATTIN